MNREQSKFALLCISSTHVYIVLFPPLAALRSPTEKCPRGRNYRNEYEQGRRFVETHRTLSYIDHTNSLRLRVVS